MILHCSSPLSTEVIAVALSITETVRFCPCSPSCRPARPGPQETADLTRACWSDRRRPAFMGSPGICAGISSGLVIMSDAAAVCGDYEEFED